MRGPQRRALAVGAELDVARAGGAEAVDRDLREPAVGEVERDEVDRVRLPARVEAARVAGVDRRRGARRRGGGGGRRGGRRPRTASGSASPRATRRAPPTAPGSSAARSAQNTSRPASSLPIASLTALKIGFSRNSWLTATCRSACARGGEHARRPPRRSRRTASRRGRAAPASSACRQRSACESGGVATTRTSGRPLLEELLEGRVRRQLRSPSSSDSRCSEDESKPPTSSAPGVRRAAGTWKARAAQPRPANPSFTRPPPGRSRGRTGSGHAARGRTCPGAARSHTRTRSPSPSSSNVAVTAPRAMSTPCTAKGRWLPTRYTSSCQWARPRAKLGSPGIRTDAVSTSRVSVERDEPAAVRVVVEHRAVALEDVVAGHVDSRLPHQLDGRSVVAAADDRRGRAGDLPGRPRRRVGLALARDAEPGGDAPEARHLPSARDLDRAEDAAEADEQPVGAARPLRSRARCW